MFIFLQYDIILPDTKSTVNKPSCKSSSHHSPDACYSSKEKKIIIINVSEMLLSNLVFCHIFFACRVYRMKTWSTRLFTVEYGSTHRLNTQKHTFDGLIGASAKNKLYKVVLALLRH